MRTPRCAECDVPLAVADTALVRRWVKFVSANSKPWKVRLANDTCLVCPRCDAYALGIEADVGAPFYSDVVCTFLTVHDWDWWNKDPDECESKSWPGFGCITCSESAFHAAVAYVQSEPKAHPGLSVEGRLRLADAAGFPLGEPREMAWRSELARLHARLNGRYTEADLERAVCVLLSVLERHPWPKTRLDGPPTHDCT